jgi:putative transposase
MRVEPYVVGSYVHVLKRGARGMPLTRDEKDRWRFVRLLYHMNDFYKDEYWERETADLSIFARPEQWPERRPIVSLLAWTLMPNHFHLIVKEITPGGVAKFVQKFSNSMSSHFNQKYNERGSLFQGSYKSRTITDDRYLRWLTSYVMVKNVFELYPGGLERAAKEFDNAWEWGQAKYQFSSLPDFVHERNFPIIEKELLHEVFPSTASFRKASKEMILARVWEQNNDLKKVILE